MSVRTIHVRDWVEQELREIVDSNPKLSEEDILERALAHGIVLWDRVPSAVVTGTLVLESEADPDEMTTLGCSVEEQVEDLVEYAWEYYGPNGCFEWGAADGFPEFKPITRPEVEAAAKRVVEHATEIFGYQLGGPVRESCAREMVRDLVLLWRGCAAERLEHIDSLGPCLAPNPFESLH